MRVTKVEIENFRSIKHLVLECDQPFVVLEGENDAGKSNIVDAIDVTLRHAAVTAWNKLPSQVQSALPVADRLPTGFRMQSLLLREPGKVLPTTARIALEVRLSQRDALPERTICVQATFTATGPDRVTGEGSLPGVEVDTTTTAGRWSADDVASLAVGMGRAVQHLGTQRHPRSEPVANRPDDRIPAWTHDNFKNILFAVKNSPRRELQQRFDGLRRELSDPGLHVGEVFAGIDGSHVFVKTRCGGVDLEMDDRSSGVQQILFLVGLGFCHEGTILVIEEPELNLSAGLQKKLWSKLRGLVGPGGLDQIFVTSHSEFFERQAERVHVRRGDDGWTTADWVAPPPPVQENMWPAEVSRAGTLELREDTRRRLGVELGGHVYVHEDDEGVSLLDGRHADQLLFAHDSGADDE